MVIGVGVSVGQSTQPLGGPSASEIQAPPDVDAGRWQRVVGQLQANGLSLESADACLAPVQEAVRQGLPADPVLMRVEEGAAKGVDANALQDAGKQRLDNLARAAEILRQAGYDGVRTRHELLMKSVTLALESGLSADTLKGVLITAGGGQSERMRSIVEAGETMRLSGMDEGTVGQMMADFSERNMRRTEVIRASRFAVQQHRAHVEGTRIRQQLWDGTGDGGRWGGGESMPCAVGSGPGAGARMGTGPGPGGGDRAGLGNDPGGNDSGSSGSGDPGRNTPSDPGPQRSTPNHGR
jgi:hypothetical protein